MNRRDAIVVLLALGAAPATVFGQAAARPYRIAVVFNGSVHTDGTYLEAFRQGLGKHGYREGGDFMLELGYADGRTDRVPARIRAAVARRPDIIVLQGSGAAAAARKETSTIPVVMAQVGDPVELGLAKSLAHPGGNITGNTVLATAYVPKSLELLHETLPAVRSFEVLTDPAMPSVPLTWSALEDAADRLRLVLERHDASTPDEIDRALAALGKRRPAALLVFPMPLFGAHRRKIVESLTRDRIPAIVPTTDATDLGALMSYVPNSSDMWLKAASFVHRILQGAKPGDLPFEQATRFEFSINLKTARALGIRIPQSVLVRADRLIE